MVTGESAPESGGDQARRPRRLRPNAFARVVRWSMLHSLVVIALWSMIAGAGVAGALLLRFDWQSEKPVVVDPNWQRLQADFAAVTDPIVIHLETSDPKRARAAAEALSESLAKRTDLFREVFMPGGGKFLEENGLLYLDRAEVERIVARIENSAPLYRGLAAAPDLGGLAVLAEQTARVVGQGGTPGGLSALFREGARTAAAKGNQQHRDLDWLSLIGDRVDLDSPKWYVFAYPRHPGDRAAIAEAETQTEALSGITAVVTGRPVLTQMQPPPAARAIVMPALIALVLSAVLLIFALSGPGQILAIVIAFVAAAAAAAGGTAAVTPVLDRSCLAAPVILMAIGTPVLIALSLRAEQAERRGISTASGWMLSAHQLGPPLSIWLLLTALAGAVIYGKDWAGLGTAGLVTATTALAAFCTGLTLLPALISLFGGPWVDEEPHWLDDLLERPEPPFLSGVQQALAVVLIAVAATGAFFVSDLRFSFAAPARLIAEGPAAERFAEAAAREPALRATAHVIAPPDKARELAQRLFALPEVGGVRTIESFLPPEEAEKRAILARLHTLLPEAPDRSLIAPDATLRGSFMRLQEALKVIAAAAASDADLKSAAESFQASLAALDEAGRASDADLRGLETALFVNLSQLLARVEALSRTEPMTISRIDPVVARQYVSPDNNWRIEIVPRDPGNPAPFLAAVHRVAPEAAGPGYIAQRRYARAVADLPYIAGAWFIAVLLAGVLGLRRAAPIAGVAVAWAALAFIPVMLIVLSRTVLRPESAGVIFGVAAAGLGLAIVREAWTDPVPHPEWSSARRATTLPIVLLLTAFAPFALSSWPPLREAGLMLTIGANILLLVLIILLPQLRHWSRPRPRRRRNFDLQASEKF
ncbi:MMPL family transporter [soil metagenome]